MLQLTTADLCLSTVLSFPGVRLSVHCGLCAVLVGSLVLEEVISSATVGTNSISWWTEQAAG